MTSVTLKHILFPRYLNRWNIFHRTYTWTPIAKAFNNIATVSTHIDTNDDKIGLFNIPELKTADGFTELTKNCIDSTDDLINEAMSPNRKRKMVEIFDEISNTLCKVADLSEFIRMAHPNPKFAKRAEEACIAVSGIVEKLNTNHELYNALKNVVQNGDIVETTPMDQHVGKLFLFDFEQSGIHLPDNDRNEVVQLNNAILYMGQQFMAGSAKSRRFRKSLLPKNIQKTFDTNGDEIVISGLQGESSNPLLREYCYKLYLTPDRKQEELLLSMLRCRYHLANKCGFKTFSERALRGSVIENPEVVMDFLKLLSTELRPKADKEFSIMSEMKINESGANVTPLAAWDILYFTQKAKRERYKVTSNEYAPYFSLGACMEGLNNLFETLYGIKLVNLKMEHGETWAGHIYKLGVMHKTEGLLGYIYCDFFERTNKPAQDCHFTIQGGKELSNNNYQLPIVVLMLNFPAPQVLGLSLLSPNMVDNLFHEMGHAMHSMLARTKYQHVTGTRCSTDFAEVPSILMEYFASDPRVLSTFARHFQTREVIPEKLLNSFCASKNIFSASELQLQVFYSALDQKYHSEMDFNDTTSVMARVQKEYYSLPYVDGTAWQLRFSHLVGYGAKYYSYLISKAIASWIWQKYFEDNPFNRDNGMLYRHECLSHGGGKPPKALAEDFLKTDITTEKLVESLIKGIDSVSCVEKKFFG